jgi:enterochelin esterase-like enzyme
VRHAHLWFTVGANDWTVANNRHLALMLRRAHVPVLLSIVPRLGHSWKLWNASLQPGLRYFSRELS